MTRMRVVMLESGKQAYIKEVNNTLRSMQKVVGGILQVFYPFDDSKVCIVCNEEGKFHGLPLNRGIYREGRLLDIIVGNAFICDCSSGDFGSLSEEQAEFYCNIFYEPERFVVIDGALCILKNVKTKR